eukprot:s2351_g11.t1
MSRQRWNKVQRLSSGILKKPSVKLKGLLLASHLHQKEAANRGNGLEVGYIVLGVLHQVHVPGKILSRAPLKLHTQQSTTKQGNGRNGMAVGTKRCTTTEERSGSNGEVARLLLAAAASDPGDQTEGMGREQEALEALMSALEYEPQNAFYQQLLTALFEDMSDNPHREGREWRNLQGLLRCCRDIQEGLGLGNSSDHVLRIALLLNSQ